MNILDPLTMNVQALEEKDKQLIKAAYRRLLRAIGDNPLQTEDIWKSLTSKG